MEAGHERDCGMKNKTSKDSTCVSPSLIRIGVRNYMQVPDQENLIACLCGFLTFPPDAA